MRRSLLTAMIAASAPLLLAASPAEGEPTEYKTLINCRSIGDPMARLACYDEATVQLEAATSRRDVLVVDKAQIRRTKRTLFGLAIPNFNLFGDAKGGDEDEVVSVDGVVASARLDQDNRWIVQLEDGATWRQIDAKPLARRPRPGFKVQINRAALGSYMMQVEGQPGIRVRRVI